jgi:hypothetical protein
LSTLSPELSGKQLELLKEIASRVAVFGTSTRQVSAQAFRETELAAEALTVKLQYLETYEIAKILRLHSEPQARDVLTRFSRWGVLCSMLSEHRLQTSR